MIALRLKRLTLFITLPLIASAVYAVQDTTWKGADGNWYNRNQWSGGMPDPSSNAVISDGHVHVNSYAQARLLRLAAGAGQKATFSLETGSTLEIGGAGTSQIGVGQGAFGEFFHSGGRMVMGNSLYIGGLLASGNGKGIYHMEDGILRIHGGDLVLAGNTTGSSVALFEQTGGEVTLENLLIAPERYRGMQSVQANQADYSALGGELLIEKSLKVGSESLGGKGAVDAVLRIGSQSNVTIEGDLSFYASEESHPVLAYALDGSAPGKLNLGPKASLNLAGNLRMELPAGIALLDASEFTLTTGGLINGAFNTVTNAELWKVQHDDAIRVRLIDSAEKASMRSEAGISQSFFSSQVGYVTIRNLRPGETFRFILDLAPGSGESLESLVQSFQKAGLSAEITPRNYIAFTFKAAAQTQYLVWDFSQNQAGTKLSGIAF